MMLYRKKRAGRGRNFYSSVAGGSVQKVRGRDDECLPITHVEHKYTFCIVFRRVTFEQK